MSNALPPIFTLEPALFGRVWGGDRLAERTEAQAPAGPVGEAWLVSDHAQCVSVVADGPRKGATLHALLEEDPAALLGADVKTAPQGRFPLLLKLLDCEALLSIQVHPDDVQAAAMNEPDAGKTELWYVLHATPEAEVLCGLDPAMTPERFAGAARDGTIEGAVTRWKAAPGRAFFVPAGVVHALGAGLLIAEIQQNSDLTYRVYDWRRMGTDGAPRELHLNKAARVTAFGTAYPGPVKAISRRVDGGEEQALTHCPYFSAASVAVDGVMDRATDGVLHLLLATDGQIEAIAEGEARLLHPGRAVLIPGRVDSFRLQGAGTCLVYTTTR